MPAASILVSMPPVPTAEPRRATSTPTRSVVRPHVDPARAGLRRVRGVEGVDVAEQDQRVGVHQVRDQGGQPVVVAEADLVGGHGVVLVDDRDHAELEQPAEGPEGVAVVAAPGDVVDGQQHLADAEAVRGRTAGVVPHQQALADRRRGLLGGQVARAGPSARAAPEPGGDRAGRDQDDLPAGQPDGGQRIDERADPGRVDAAGRRWSARTSRP